MDALIRNSIRGVLLDDGDILLLPANRVLPCGDRETDTVVEALAAVGRFTVDEEVAYHRAALRRV